MNTHTEREKNLSEIPEGIITYMIAPRNPTRVTCLIRTPVTGPGPLDSLACLLACSLPLCEPSSGLVWFIIQEIKKKKKEKNARWSWTLGADLD